MRKLLHDILLFICALVFYVACAMLVIGLVSYFYYDNAGAKDFIIWSLPAVLLGILGLIRYPSFRKYVSFWLLQW